ncbi:MAG: J domain-containing protein [Verrucomicrobiota bacterium]
MRISETEKLFWQARARIVWGESARSVRTFLIANGVAQSLADERIAAFLQEKHADMRRSGCRDLLQGLALACASGGVLFYILNYGTAALGAIGSAGAPLLLITIYGLWKSLEGLGSILEPLFDPGVNAPKKEPRTRRRHDSAAPDREVAQAQTSPFHQVLGVTPGASPAEIKKAYRNCVKMYHPDRFENEPEEMRSWADEMTKSVNAAYEALTKLPPLPQSEPKDRTRTSSD